MLSWTFTLGKKSVNIFENFTACENNYFFNQILSKQPKKYPYLSVLSCVSVRVYVELQFRINTNFFLCFIFLPCIVTWQAHEWAFWLRMTSAGLIWLSRGQTGHVGRCFEPLSLPATDILRPCCSSYVFQSAPVYFESLDWRSLVFCRRLYLIHYCTLQDCCFSDTGHQSPFFS